MFGGSWDAAPLFRGIEERDKPSFSRREGVQNWHREGEQSAPLSKENIMNRPGFKPKILERTPRRRSGVIATGVWNGKNYRMNVTDSLGRF